MPSTTIHATVRGLPLACHRWGNEEGPTIVLLHGFLDCGRSWTHVAEGLAGAYNVLAPDMRGFGESGWVGAGGYYHFYDYFQDVIGLLDTFGVGSFDLVGHSMGGSIATGVAALVGDRCRSLVLLEGLGPPANDAADTVRRLRLWTHALGRYEMLGDAQARRAMRRVLPGLVSASQRLRKYNPRLTRERAMELAAHLTEPGPAGKGVVFRHDPLHMTPSAKPFYLAEARALWGAVAMPVLALSGAESKMPTEDLGDRLAALPAGRSLVVPGAGHNIHHDRPDIVAAAIEAWVTHKHMNLPAELVDAMPAAGRPASLRR